MSIELLKKLAEFLKTENRLEYYPKEGNPKLNQSVETILGNLEMLLFGDKKIQREAKREIKNECNITFVMQENGEIHRIGEKNG